MANLDGTWIYQSFRPSMAPPAPVVPWSPPGRLTVKTDPEGRVDGKLTIPLPPGSPVPELVLSVSGSVTPASAMPAPIPAGIRITGRLDYGDGRESVNELIGYFVDKGSVPVIVGTVWAVKNDPGGEADGTYGPFVLVPAG